MSLICSECMSEMQPSDSFPGREGTLVYPNALAMVWFYEGSEKMGWDLVYLEPKHWASLCFECIETKIPENRRGILKQIYKTYELEIKSDEIAESQIGRIVGSNELGVRCDARDRFRAEKAKINYTECLICDSQIRKEQKPFFMARTIDKVYGIKHLSGLGFFGTNYSVTNIRNGITAFPICFNCMQLFSNTFAALGSVLSGKAHPKLKKPEDSGIFITEEALRKLKEDLSPQEFEKIQREFKVRRIQ